MEYLFGTYTHSLDERGRLAMPSRLRDRLGENVWVTMGREKCLMVYPKATFDALVKHVLDIPPWDAQGVDIRTVVFGNASFCEIDKQGRILVPANLREDAGIGNEVVIVGTGDYLAVWAPAEWAHKRGGLQAHPPDLKYSPPTAGTS